jgi:hypothetical protein
VHRFGTREVTTFAELVGGRAATTEVEVLALRATAFDAFANFSVDALE